jgi:hypothetical protein
LFVAQADPDSVYRALKAFGCHWKKKEGRRKKKETRPLNPEAPLQEHGKTVVFKPATCRGFQNGAEIEPQLVQKKTVSAGHAPICVDPRHLRLKLGTVRLFVD